MQERTLEFECASNKATLYESKLRNGGSDTCVLFEGNRLTQREFQDVLGSKGLAED